MAFQLATYRKLYRAMLGARTSKAKGNSLNKLTRYLLSCLQGVIVERSEVRTDCEEIDIVLWNGQTDPVLRVFDAVVFVECKNWESKVGARDIGWFLLELERRRLHSGIFVARNGVTGRFGRDSKAVIMQALAKGIRIVVLTDGDLKAITSLRKLREIVRRKYCALYVGKLR